MLDFPNRSDYNAITFEIVMAKRKLTAIDVFSGCGGTTQGLKDAGFRVVAGIECEPLAVASYRRNHRGTKVWDVDICELEPRALLRHHGLRKGQLDLLVGCPPCQAFSSLRRLNGKRKVRDRHSKDLVFEFLRLVEAINPKVVMIENVPHLIKDYRFSNVQKRLRELGFHGQPGIFNSADCGVPQRRRRLVYIASRVGPIELTKEKSVERFATVRDTISGLPVPGSSGDPIHDFPENRSRKIQDMIARIPRDGGSRRSLDPEFQLECHRKCDGFKDVYGRMSWDDVAPTITGGCVNPSKGRFLHPDQDRTITLREAAMLQTFPRDYYFSLDKGKFAVALMIGNAFPPLFVKHHAMAIRKHLLAKGKF